MLNVCYDCQNKFLSKCVNVTGKHFNVKHNNSDVAVMCVYFKIACKLLHEQ